MHQASYNGMSFLSGDKTYAVVSYTSKNDASETTQGKQIPTEVSQICVVPG